MRENLLNPSLGLPALLIGYCVSKFNSKGEQKFWTFKENFKDSVNLNNTEILELLLEMEIDIIRDLHLTQKKTLRQMFGTKGASN